MAIIEKASWAAIAALGLGLFAQAGCGDDDDDTGGTDSGVGGDSAGKGGEAGESDGGLGFEERAIDVCDPTGSFTLEIDNPYFPLAVGTELVLEGDEKDDEGESVSIRVEISVLDQTEEVAGVTTRVVEEAEYEDGEIVELSRNFYAQADDGTVCYFGEDVDDYEDGDVVAHEGAWRAGEDDALPGIIMPGTPTVGTSFKQESAPDVAEDMSAVVELDVPVSTPAGHFDEALHAIDWNPLEGDTAEDAEDKYYVEGIGLVIDDVVQLTSYDIAE